MSTLDEKLARVREKSIQLVNELGTPAIRDFGSITLDNTSHVVDGDTIGNYRTKGFDTFEVENDNGVEASPFGSAATQVTADLLQQGPIRAKIQGMDVYGRSIINTPAIKQAQLEAGLAAPTSLYDVEGMDTTRQKIKELRSQGLTEQAQALSDLLQEKIDKDPSSGFLYQASNAPAALAGGAQRLLGGLGDLALEGVAQVPKVLGFEDTAKGIAGYFDETKSREVAAKNWGDDSASRDALAKQALFNLKEGEIGNLISNTARLGVGYLAESIPDIALMFAPGIGKVNAAKRSLEVAKATKNIAAISEAKKTLDAFSFGQRMGALATKSPGVMVLAGVYTNNQVEERMELTGEDVGLGAKALMFGSNLALLSLDKMVFADVVKNKTLLKNAFDTLSEGGKKGILLGVAKAAVTGTTAVSKEAAQEYLQTWGEILNVNLGVNSQTFEDIINNPDFQDDALIGAIAGAGAGGTANVPSQLKELTVGASTSLPKATAKVKEAYEKIAGTTSESVKARKETDTISNSILQDEVVASRINAVDPTVTQSIEEYSTVRESLEASVNTVVALMDSKADKKVVGDKINEVIAQFDSLNNAQSLLIDKLDNASISPEDKVTLEKLIASMDKEIQSIIDVSGGGLDSKTIKRVSDMFKAYSETTIEPEDIVKEAIQKDEQAKVVEEAVETQETEAKPIKDISGDTAKTDDLIETITSIEGNTSVVEATKNLQGKELEDALNERLGRLDKRKQEQALLSSMDSDEVVVATQDKLNTISKEAEEAYTKTSATTDTMQPGTRSKTDVGMSTDATGSTPRGSRQANVSAPDPKGFKTDVDYIKSATAIGIQAAKLGDNKLVNRILKDLDSIARGKPAFIGKMKNAASKAMQDTLKGRSGYTASSFKKNYNTMASKHSGTRKPVQTKEEKPQLSRVDSFIQDTGKEITRIAYSKVDYDENTGQYVDERVDAFQSTLDSNVRNVVDLSGFDRANPRKNSTAVQRTTLNNLVKYFNKTKGILEKANQSNQQDALIAVIDAKLKSIGDYLSKEATVGLVKDSKSGKQSFLTGITSPLGMLKLKITDTYKAMVSDGGFFKSKLKIQDKLNEVDTKGFKDKVKAQKTEENMSTLANGIAKVYAKTEASIAKIFKDINPISRKGYDAKGNPLAPFNTKGTAWLDQSEIRNLLTTLGEGSPNQLDPHIIASIAINAFRELEAMPIKMSFEDVARALDLESMPTDPVAQAVLRKYAELGEFRAVIANSLGGAIYQSLGIQYDKDMARQDTKARLKAELGELALAVLADQGLIDFVDTVTAKEYARDMATLGKDVGTTVNPEAKVVFVRPKLNKDKSEKAENVVSAIESLKIEDSGEFIDSVFGRPNRNIGLSSRPYKDASIREKADFISLPEEDVNTLAKLTNTPWKLDPNWVALLDKEDNEVELLNLLLENTNPITDISPDGLSAWLDENVHTSLKDSALYSIEGTLQSISKAKEGLAELRRDPKWDTSMPVYLSYAMLKQGRFGPESNTLNPQMDKFHRALLLPSAVHSKETSKSDINDLNITSLHVQGLATLFGMDEKTKNNPGERDNLLNNLINYIKGNGSVIEKLRPFIASFEEGTITGEGIKEVTAILSDSFMGNKLDSPKGYTVMTAARELLNTYDLYNGNKESYQSYAIIEEDGRTNGFAIMSIQTSLFEDIGTHLARSGMYLEGEGIPKDDSYQSIAREIPNAMTDFAEKRLIDELSRLDRLKTAKEREDYSKRPEIAMYIHAIKNARIFDTSKLFTSMAVTPDQVDGIIELLRNNIKLVAAVVSNDMQDAIKSITGQSLVENDSVTKFARDFIKNPFMIVNYAASLFTVARNVKENAPYLLYTQLNKLADSDLSPVEMAAKFKVITKGLEKLNVKVEVDPNQVIDKKFLLGFNLKREQEVALMTTLGSYMGNGLAAAIDSRIGEVQAFREHLNATFHLQYEAFNLARKHLVDAAIAENKANNVKFYTTKDGEFFLTETQADLIMEKLTPLIPSFKGPSKVMEDGVGYPAFQIEKQVSSNGKATIEVTHLGVSGKSSSSMTIQALIRDIEPIGVGAGAAMVQAIDGWIMRKIAEKFPDVEHVHDAIKIPPRMAIEVAKYANELMYQVSTEYNMFEDAMEALYRKMELSNSVRGKDSIDLTKDTDVHKTLTELIKSRANSGTNFYKQNETEGKGKKYQQYMKYYSFERKIDDKETERAGEKNDLMFVLGASYFMNQTDDLTTRINEGRAFVNANLSLVDQYPSPSVIDSEGEDGTYRITEENRIQHNDITLKGGFNLTSKFSLQGWEKVVEDTFGKASDEIAIKKLEGINRQISKIVRAIEKDTTAISKKFSAGVPFSQALKEKNSKGLGNTPFSNISSIVDNIVGEPDQVLGDSESLMRTYALLSASDNTDISPQHSNILVNVLSSIITSGLDSVNEVRMHIKDNLGYTSENVGEARGTNIFLFRATAVDGTSDMSQREIFTHELVHAVLAEIIRKFPSHLTQIAYLRDQVLEAYNSDRNALATIFIEPGDISQASLDKALAKVDYIFFNKETYQNVDKGLHEFVAYTLTNENMYRATSNVKAKAGKKVEVFKGDSIFNKVANWFYDLLRNFFNSRSKERKGENIQQELFNVITNMLSVEQAARQEAKTGIANKIYKAIDRGNEAAKSVIDKGLDRIKDRRDALAKQGDKVISGEVLDSFKPYLYKAMVATNKVSTDGENLQNYVDFSLEMDVTVKSMNDLKKFSKEKLGGLNGSISMAIDNIFNADPSNAQVLDLFNQFKYLVSTVPANIESAVNEGIESAFTVKLSKEEDVSITKTLIKTDMAAVVTLFKGDLAKTASLMFDNAERANFYSSVESIINTKMGEHSKPIMTQIDGLSTYMSSGKTSVDNLALNIENLLAGRMYEAYDKDYAKKMYALSQKLTAKDLANIEAYVSLRAYDKTTDTDKRNLVNVWVRENSNNKEDNGITNLFKYVETYKKESDAYLFEGSSRLKVKGHVSSKYDVDHEFALVRSEDAESMKKLGFSVVEQNLSGPVSEGLVMMVNRYSASSVFDSGPLNSVLLHSRGSDVQDMMEAMGSVVNADTVGAQIHYLKTENAKKAYMEQVLGTKVKDVKEQGKLIPITNSQGVVVNYRFNMDEAKQEALLGKNNRVTEVIGRSFATISRKKNSETISNKVFDSLVKDYQENGKATPNEFIWINNNEMQFGAENQYIAEYRKIPKALRDKADIIFAGRGVPVRKDQIPLVFGQQKMSLTNSYFARFLQEKFPNIPMKYYVGVAETIWQEIVFTAKSSIVIRLPEVLLGNVLSNTVHLVTRGVPVMQAVKLQIEGVKALRKDEENFKELTKLESIYKAERNENKRKVLEGQINKYTTLLNNSPLKDMFDAGMYKTIAEDVNVTKFGYLDKFSAWIGDKSGTSKTSKVAQTVFDYAFLTSNTGPYKLLSKSTQYSDFVSRYALITHETTKNKDRSKENQLSKEEIYKDAFDSFVNYDLPDGKALEYANSMGVVMFTKFFLGIQRAIYKQTKDRAVSTAALTGAQVLLGDIDDILDASLLTYDLDKKIYGPLEILDTFFTPHGLEIVKDIFN